LDFIDILLSEENSYLLVFVLVLLLSIIPILTPPSWMIVVSSYTLNPSLEPILLSIVSATSATIGRFLLMKFSSVGRRIVSQQRKNSLEKLKNRLEETKYGYFLGTLLFGFLPLPSNMLFVSYGLMKVKSFQIIFGFWIGRFTVYMLMIYMSGNILKPIKNTFDLNFTSIIIIDIAGIIMTIFILLIDWNKFIVEKKLGFIKPRKFIL
jgi:uncharacterized membrane protein YdjX (TVP38/TMEM64 family)